MWPAATTATVRPPLNGQQGSMRTKSLLRRAVAVPVREVGVGLSAVVAASTQPRLARNAQAATARNTNCVSSRTQPSQFFIHSDPSSLGSLGGVTPGQCKRRQ